MDLHPHLREQLESVIEKPCAVKSAALRLLYAWQTPPMDAADYLSLMLRTERLVRIIASGNADNEALVTAIEEATFPRWADIPELPCDKKLQTRLGDRMLEQVKLKPAMGGQIEGKFVQIETALNNRRAVEATVQYCLNEGMPLDITFDDIDFNTLLVNALPDEQVNQLADFTRKRLATTDPQLFFLEAKNAEKLAPRNAHKFELLKKGEEEHKKRRRNSEVRWVLTDLPSAADAQRDGFPSYEAYLDYFFEAIEQPFSEIHEAQGKALIPAFNNGHELHITNNDGTDVRVKIDGMQFANSAPGRNLPGSEFFSGPTSVDGKVVAKGNFAYELDGKLLEMSDLELTFEQGKVVKAIAGKGQAALDTILARDGANHVGEIGIGTNPFIRRHLVNGLLVEKISGSFHLALGAAYGDEYMGEDVHMDNGNRSKEHWDITTMLRGKDGKMMLDGHLIQDDGVWVPCPALGIKAEDIAVLNDGWKAVPSARRPEYINRKLAAEQHVAIG